MKLELSDIRELELFHGIRDEELTATLEHLKARAQTLSKGTVLFFEGAPIDRLAIVLSGAVNIVRDDADGRESLIEQAVRGDPVGAAFACAGLTTFQATALAATDATVLTLDARRLLDERDDPTFAHDVLLRHLLSQMARKSLMLQRKIVCLSQKTTRQKLLTFLRMAQRAAGREVFEIPYTRQQLADYLNVARAALSAEIGKLVRAGVLETDHKAFRLRLF